MSNTAKRTLAKALLCGFLLAALGSFFPFAAASQQLPQNIIRLHVVANSNSPADQAVKLQVRDAILAQSAAWYTGAQAMEDANFAICTHLQSITQAANRTLQANGFPPTAKAQVTDMYFSTRDYETFSLPAGTYRTLRVTIGEGKGRNWWCVVFPALCLPAASEAEDVLSALPESQRDIVEHPQKYQVEFKLVEWYERLRAMLS